jgi:hypothetical protein
MTELFYAHSKDGEPPEGWQPLEDHLTRVAEMARSFADHFGQTIGVFPSFGMILRKILEERTLLNANKINV